MVSSSIVEIFCRPQTKLGLTELYKEEGVHLGEMVAAGQDLATPLSVRTELNSPSLGELDIWVLGHRYSFNKSFDGLL